MATPAKRVQRGLAAEHVVDEVAELVEERDHVVVLHQPLRLKLHTSTPSGSCRAGDAAVSVNCAACLYLPSRGCRSR